MARGLWVVAVLAAGCGHGGRVETSVESRVFHPTEPGELTFDPDAPPALSAIPRTPLPARIAVYARNEDLAERVADSLEGLQGVEDTYVVRSYVVDGRSRWSSPATYLYPYTISPYYGAPPQELDLEQLRSVSAMAHCDVLLVVDHAYKQRVSVNGWIVLSPLLVPLLTTPFLHTEDSAYLDVHAIDVRSGYLYGQVSHEARGERGPVTIYTSNGFQPILDQLDLLLEQNRAEISDLLWWHLMTDTPAPPRAAAVSSARREGGVVSELPAAPPADEAQ